MRGEQGRELLADRGVTRREAEILAALADRPTNAEVAASLQLSERTVEAHVTSLLRKLEARNRVELGDLAREILRGPDRPPPPLPAPLEVLVSSTRFVGRVSEMARLHELWARAEAGELLVGLVAGAAGMGKSRLVAELAVELHRAGVRVQWTACLEEVPVPYHPFVQAINADVAALPRPELRRRAGDAAARLAWLVPELDTAKLSPAADDIVDPVSAQAEVASALRGYLTRSADVTPLLLVVEDLHWATSTTLAALRHLAWESGPARALVLVTTRDAAPDVDTDLAGFLADVGRLPAVERIDLAGLNGGEVAALIGSLGGAADPGTVIGETGGNPLFVRELAGDGGSRTGSMSTLLARRYALLDQEDLATLDLAAVLGSTFDAEVLAAAARPRSSSAVLESLGRAEDAGLVVHSPGRQGEVSFLHALFSAARYDDIPPARRTELHRQVVAALRERADDGSVLPELARHAALAGPTEGYTAAGRALRRSGDRDLALNDFGAAERAYQGALALLPGDDPERPPALLGLGRALLTRTGQGTDVLTEARDGLLATGDVDGAAEAEVMLGELDWIGSQWKHASTHFDRAAALVDDRPPSRQTARVFVGLARFAMIAGDSRAARTYGARALALARTLGLRAIEADVLITLGPTRVGDGDLDGVEDVVAGVALAEALNTPTVSRGYANLSYVYGLLGELRPNHEWRQRTREAAERFGVTELRRWSRAHDTEHWWFVGEWDRALANAEAFIAELEPSAYYLVAVCLRVRAQVRMGRGNQIGALADAAAAAEFARGASHPSNLLVALPFSARCLLEAGRLADANAAITETVTAAAGLENMVDPIQTAVVMWGLGRATEFLDIASRATIESRRWDIGRTIAAGHLERAADLLAKAGHRSYEASVRLLAAEQLHTQGRRGDAQTQLRLALAFHRSVDATAYVRRGEQLSDVYAPMSPGKPVMTSAADLVRYPQRGLDDGETSQVNLP